MDFLIAILAVALVAVVVLVISAPLRAAPLHTARRAGDVLSAEQGELEAAREAKYREIRDAELDFRTGKLSREDYEAIDRTLRAEALAILNRLERSEEAPASAPATPGRPSED